MLPFVNAFQKMKGRLPINSLDELYQVVDYIWNNSPEKRDFNDVGKGCRIIREELEQNIVQAFQNSKTPNLSSSQVSPILNFVPLEENVTIFSPADDPVDLIVNYFLGTAQPLALAS